MAGSIDWDALHMVDNALYEILDMVYWDAAPVPQMACRGLELAYAAVEAVLALETLE